MSAAFTDIYIRNLKTVGRYTDAATQGLNLQVKESGGKYWTFRYLYQSKRHDLGLGTYPAISLKEARARATNARNELNQGQRPLAIWKPKPAVTVNAGNETRPIFSEFAKSCIDSKKAEWRNDKHGAQWYSTIKQYADPVIGGKHLDEIDTDDILRILNPIWHTKTVTASRLRGRIEWVLASATTRKLRSGMNPAAWRGHLETILPKPNRIKNEQHHKALPYKEIHEFIKKLQEVDGIAALALEFLILNANRTSEVIGGLRAELKGNDVWVIPKDRMKAHSEHRVPLGKRSLELIETVKSLDPDSDYLFSSNGKPLSNMAMSMLLRRMGYEITVHGFRSTFRDWVAEETQHSPEVAEKALAHTIASKTEKAYRRGDLLEPRRRLMCDWENYCQTGQWGNVVATEQKVD